MNRVPIRATIAALKEMQEHYQDFVRSLHEARSYRANSALDLGRDFLSLTSDVDAGLLAQQAALALGISEAPALHRFFREAALRNIPWNQVWSALERSSFGVKGIKR